MLVVQSLISFAALTCIGHTKEGAAEFVLGLISSCWDFLHLDAPSLITAPFCCLFHFHREMQCLATLQARAQHVETNREQLVQEERRALGMSTGSRALLRSGSRMPVSV